jgi:hypothetical protein
MLFILVMDVLGYLIAQAAREGLLQPLSTRNLQHRISLYADDVVLFLRPEVSDISITTDTLNIFGEASGLKTNLQKSSVLPIRCGDSELTAIQNLPHCRSTAGLEGGVDDTGRKEDSGSICAHWDAYIYCHGD